ncbi:MAG: PD-(D/E)XK nuclease family protein [Prochlorococcaceae cyanobacterium]
MIPAIALRQYDYTPQLGWSSTRWETFRSCRRRYFYQYYARYDREFEQGRIQRLKQLSSIPMTVGTVVHDVLAKLLQRLLQSSAEIDQARFWPYVQNAISRELEQCSLMEVHYGQRPAPEPAELMGPVRRCLETFLASDRYGWVRDQLDSDPRHLIEPPGYGEARLQGMKIYAKVDFLLEAGGQAVILDWKSGRRDIEKHTRQLLGYAAWAQDNLQVSAEQIRCVVAYLQPEYEEIEKQPTSAELEGLALEVAAEIEQMRRHCQDPERNIPLAKDRFPLTENLGHCRHCAFRELCDRVDAGGAPPRGELTTES